MLALLDALLKCGLHIYAVLIVHGHRAADCTNPVACAKCAGSHETNNCTEDFEKCVNCHKEGKQDGHRADSANCTVYIEARGKN